jgi:uncharacterized protein (DUF58 family)
MTLRPGPNLLWLAAAAVAISAAGFFIPVATWLLLPLFIVTVGLAVSDRVWLGQHRAELVIARELPAATGRDVPFDVVFRCSNRNGRKLQGTLREVAPSAASPRWWTARFALDGSAAAVHLRQSFRIPIRGRFEFGPAWVSLAAPFGVLEGMWEVAGRSGIKIFPEGLVSKDDLSQHVNAEVQLLDRRSRSRRRSPGIEFESISEYRPGDDPRRIDWRVTARMRRLVVRRFQVEQHQDVLVLIDCGRLMGTDAGRGSKLDRAVDAALILSRVALAGNDRCGVALFDSQVLGYLPPRGSLAAFPTIVECVYAAQSRWQETDFAALFAHLQVRQQKRALVVVLSDVGDEETSRRACISLAGLAKRHVVMFAALQTPLVLVQTQFPIHERLDAARQAVAYRLLRERERTLHVLRRSNVEVLDVAPTALVVPLVNRFLQLRARNVV